MIDQGLLAHELLQHEQGPSLNALAQRSGRRFGSAIAWNGRTAESGSIQNPADVTAGIFNDMSLLTRTIEIVLPDPGVDQLCILLASIPGAASCCPRR